MGQQQATPQKRSELEEIQQNHPFAMTIGPGLTQALALSAQRKIEAELGPRKRKATTEESAAQSREEDTQSKQTQHAQQQVVAKPPPEQKERPKFNGSVRDAIIQERIREAQDTIASLEESELKAEKVLKERINRLKQMYSRAAAAPSRRVGEMTCEDQRRATLSCLNDGSNPARCEELLLAFQNCTIETRVGAKAAAQSPRSL